MTRWIRWWGLGAFVMFAAILGGVWVFLVDGWVKGVIEGVGTRVVGAKVELDAADLSLFPVGLSLTRLQVTNPKAPMTNAVEVAHVTMGIDGLNLLRRKVIVEEMGLVGVRLGTPRATSGAVKPTAVLPEEDSGMFSLALPSFDVPDVKKILEQEDLETIRLIDALKADMQREQEAWEPRLKELPGKAQLIQYKARVKKLKKAGKGGLEGVLGGVEEVQSLKRDIEQDIKSLKDAQDEFEGKVALLHTRLDQIQTAPKRDIQRLKAKYNVSPQGLANVSQTLLGAKIGSWVRQGATWYERAKPFLEGAHAAGAGEAGPQVSKPLRGKGVDVHFEEAHPLPDFLIRLTKVSVDLEIGDLAGSLHNITNDQPTLGQPTTFVFSGDRLKGVKSVSLEGSLNHVVPTNSKDQLTVQAEGYELTNLALSKVDTWPVTLTSGMGDFKMNAELQGQALTARGGGYFRDLQVSAGTEGDMNPLTKSLSNAVAGVSQLSLQADVKGTLEQYEVTVSSDLDRILQGAAGKMMNELAARFGAELQAAISAKIAEPLQQLKNNLSGLEGMAGELTERVAQHTDVLKSLLEKSLPTKGLKNLPGGFKLPF